jgi:hypothetical protein
MTCAVSALARAKFDQAPSPCDQGLNFCHELMCIRSVCQRAVATILRQLPHVRTSSRYILAFPQKPLPRGGSLSVRFRTREEAIVRSAWLRRLRLALASALASHLRTMGQRLNGELAMRCDAIDDRRK